MTLRDARHILRHGGEWVQLADAIGVVISSRATQLSDLLLGVDHPGFVVEQAQSRFTCARDAKTTARRAGGHSHPGPIPAPGRDRDDHGQELPAQGPVSDGPDGQERPCQTGSGGTVLNNAVAVEM